MHGILFTGNHDLRRILSDYGFQNFPLRKDFPLTGQYEKQYYQNEKTLGTTYYNSQRNFGLSIKLQYQK
jgi:NADH:ubiquinone oxidoreductase subunit C